MFGFFISLAT